MLIYEAEQWRIGVSVRMSLNTIREHRKAGVCIEKGRPFVDRPRISKDWLRNYLFSVDTTLTSEPFSDSTFTT
jgi:hypothetical protein